MNIQEYIESGIIELYVMNTLPESEMAEVEAMARQYPDIQAEIEEVQAVMQVYSQAHAISPSPELKDKILNKINSEIAANAHTKPTSETLNPNPVTSQPLLSTQEIPVETVAGKLNLATILAFNGLFC